MTSIECPNCAQPVDLQARYCKHCGVDLALAAVLAEQKVLPQAPVPAGYPLAPEILVPRMGETMIEKGLLKTEDLQRALDYQEEKNRAGRPVLIGQALLELGLINRESLDSIITLQILSLQTALSEANRQLEQRVHERTQELQRALERLAELNQLKSNFIANISHELRTPLTHIKGYLDLLAEGDLGTLTKQQGNALAVLKRSEVRLEKLIEDLIQFSLASRGELSLDCTMASIEPLVRMMVERLFPRAKANQIDLSYQVYPPLPQVRMDEDKIGWVISQLLDNALKFTPHGGRVTVEVRSVDGMVNVLVQDSGIGIPPDRLNEIFEPFHQLDGSATRRYAGTGLGLAMVRRIIEAHGAQILARSAVGKGASFEFSLPAAAVKELAGVEGSGGER